MNNLVKHIKRIPDYAHSLVFNLKVFPFSTAIKLPVILRRDVKVLSCHRGCIEFTENIHFGMVRIGFPAAPMAQEGKTKILCGPGSKIIIGDKAILAAGSRIIVTDGGVLKIGNNLFSNVNFSVQCEESITFGNDVLIGWNVSVRDTDGHTIYHEGKTKNKTSSVVIGDHVWIASDATIIKGSHITGDSVVACNSLVSGLRMEKEGCLIAGVPAKIIKENISWME